MKTKKTHYFQFLQSNEFSAFYKSGGNKVNRYVRISVLLFVDSVVSLLAVYFAYLLRFDFRIPESFHSAIPYVMANVTGFTLSALFYCKVYRRIWKYATVRDLLSIVQAIVIAMLLAVSFHHLVLNPLHQYSLLVPRSVYLIASMMMVLGVGASRLVWRIFRDRYIKLESHHKRTLVIGAGSAGSLVIKELRQARSEYYPVAFIDDDPNKGSLEVMGIPVVGKRDAISSVVEKYNIENIIIALPSASRLQISEIINICKETGRNVKIIPRVNDLIDGKVSINTIRNVSVEDLLGREPIRANLSEIADYVEYKTVLITGAGGSIGSELSRQIASYSPGRLILLGHGENSIYDIELELRKKNPMLDIVPIIADVQDKPRLEQVFRRFLPKVVFHAAAHKHVPLMENNPIEAIKNNVLGTKNVAECSLRFHAERFVLISTDKAVNPVNVMGATKKLAEMIVLAMNGLGDTRFSAVRFGNVLGSRGSVIPIFKKQIEEGGPVTVTHPEMIRYFMTIPEAVQLVIQAGAIAQGGEVFILDMGKPVKIVDLARDLIRLSGYEPNKDIEIIFTGVRPGEKLFEELFTSEEGTLATKYEQIFIGRSERVVIQQIQEMVTEFEEMANTGNQPSAEHVKKKLMKWLPSYRSQDGLEKLNSQEINEAIKASLEVVASLENKG